MTAVLTTRAELTAARSSATGRVGAVFTMGALHAGHEALLRAARAECDTVLATVFVNPTQFAAGEDLSRYPRTLEADLEVCARAGVDAVWAPAVADVYPRPTTTVVSGGLLADDLEGAVRPGHFDGVLLVVAKLLGLTRPHRTFFGEKDFQQLTLVRRLCADLDLGVEVVAVPTVREPDGLAMSSRNVYLSPDERRRALVVWRALAAGRAAGATGAAAVLVAAQGELAGVDVDYVALRDPDLGPTPSSGPARLLIAARVGSTRLIDNAEVWLT